MEDRELARTVGATIAARRKQLGLTQAELAEKLDIGQESLSRMENGQISPKFSRLQSFADALGCSVADLFRSKKDDVHARSATIVDLIQPLSAEGQEAIVNIIAELVQVIHTPSHKGL